MTIEANGDGKKFELSGEWFHQPEKIETKIDSFFGTYRQTLLHGCQRKEEGDSMLPS
jgi:hypothetical protein